jgi:hypothetical protein
MQEKVQVTSYEDGQKKVHGTFDVSEKDQAEQVAASIPGGKTEQVLSDEKTQEVHTQ